MKQEDFYKLTREENDYEFYKSIKNTEYHAKRTAANSSFVTWVVIICLAGTFLTQVLPVILK